MRILVTNDDGIDSTGLHVLARAMRPHGEVVIVDWRIGDEGDSGIYLRGTPQVQIWDTSRTDVGAQVG